MCKFIHIYSVANPKNWTVHFISRSSEYQNDSSQNIKTKFLHYLINPDLGKWEFIAESCLFGKLRLSEHLVTSQKGDSSKWENCFIKKGLGIRNSYSVVRREQIFWRNFMRTMGKSGNYVKFAKKWWINYGKPLPTNSDDFILLVTNQRDFPQAIF